MCRVAVVYERAVGRKIELSGHSVQMRSHIARSGRRQHLKPSRDLFRAK